MMKAKTQTQSITMARRGDLLAALSIDDLRLLLPHHEVHTLEPVADLQTKQKKDHVVGWIMAGTVRIPIYCLSRDLIVLDTIPNVRRIAVVMITDEGSIGILCDDLKIIPRKQLAEQPLPYCMHAPDTPLTGLASQENTVYCLSSANHMLKFLKDNPLPPNTRTSV